jgi:RNA polymerase sigma factor for flagellar operon FliA
MGSNPAQGPESGEPERSVTPVKGCAARAALERGVHAYLPLVRRVVRQLARRLPPNVQRDDLLSAGTCGLVDSLRRNGGDQGAAFEWYARTRIKGAIVDELRSQDWLSRRARAAGVFVSFEDVASEDAANFAGADDPSEAIESRSLCRALARALQQLSERERTVVARHYLEGSRLKDIGAELGVSEPRISQILARALARLREILHGETA